ncbi:hypothetical protein SDC9_159789 [bioreactor metagenome]|uniref:ABC-2 type transporter domain-containing protein n=1 Tax=bioreactor metagenome TaxID=1076179 RepID=A0A645FDL5_9ZZZZ
MRSGKISALFKREVARYFSSTIYVMNTAFSYVMLLAAGVALLVKADAVAEYLHMPELTSAIAAVPFGLGWIVSMGVTTASAISMEGKSLWIIKSLPVSAREWLLSKLLVTLMLAVPSIFITSTLVVIGLRPGLMDAIWMYAVPLAFSVSFGVFGLWLNLRMPRLDWKNEAEVVKQGGSIMVCIFTGMGVGFGSAIIAGATGSPFVAPTVILFLALMAALLWNSLMKSGESRLLKLN